MADPMTDDRIRAYHLARARVLLAELREALHPIPDRSPVVDAATIRRTPLRKAGQ